MANVKFTRKDFEREIKLDKKTLSLIPLFGTPIESLTDEEIELEIFPNRPDLLSLTGFIRAFKAFQEKSPGLKEYKLNKPQKNYEVKIDSSVKSIRPYTVCAIVKNLKLDNEKIIEIINLQEKLHSTLGRNRKKAAIGVYPLEKIKLPIKYLAKKPKDIKFRPLEFPSEITGQQILQKHPTGRDYSSLLSDYDRYPIFQDANEKILSMPPIINSHETGKVSTDTKEVFVECSGSHLETLRKTLNIIVTTLSDMGGEIYQMNLDYGKEKLKTPDLSPEVMSISLENTNNLLGLDLKEKDIKKLLERMGHNYKSKKVEIASWRSDILHEVDLIEDIAIAYGYDKFEPEVPEISTVGSESDSAKLNRKISEILQGLGLLEITTYHLIKEDEKKKAKLKECIETENSKTEYKLLRPNLLIPTLRILSENKDNEYPQKIYEIGTVFNNSDKSDTGVEESEHLIISPCPGNFTETKQILDYLFKNLDLSYELEESEKSLLINGRTAEILLDKKAIGYIGEVHPETLKSWGIKMPLSVIEISLEEILAKKY